MSIAVLCRACGRRLKARDEFAGKRAECPGCGRIVEIPDPAAALAAAAASDSTGEPADDTATKITRFLDPPNDTAPSERSTAPPEKSVMRRMLETLLDPRAIHWLLMIGGGLVVIGLIIWLVSKGLFEDPRAVAVAMGIGSVAMLAAGWYTTLKTRYRVAGQALTFLACVVAPLNLWFYHAQRLITLENHLWVGGVVCVLLYAATVFALRDGLFMYAVEAGITLTIVLLMADLGQVSDVAHLALWLVALAFVSIHAERAFAPEGQFPRRRFGLPLFWSGQALLAFSLLLLLASQVAGWLARPLFFNWPVDFLTDDDYLVGGLWLAGTYLYVYSDLVVRRIGVYVYVAAGCLLMAEVTLLLPHLQQEGLIATLALTAIALHVFNTTVSPDSQSLKRHLNVIAGGLGQLPVIVGVLLHIRATSDVFAAVQAPYTTGWLFVGAMLLTAATNRLSAYLLRSTERKLSAIHFFFSAAALLVAAAGLLRQIGLTDWSEQAPVIMLIPIAYILSSRLWRGRDPEAPLARVAHASTAVILLGTLVGAVEQGDVSLLEPVVQNVKNLLFGVTFAEAALFYALAGIFRRRSWNAYLAMAGACGASWQFLGYFGVATVWYELLFAVLGVVLLIVGRLLGVQGEQRYAEDGERLTVLRGVGLKALECGNAVLTLALIVTFFKQLNELAIGRTEWLDLIALLSSSAAGAAAIVIVPSGGWRRWYTTAAIALLCVTFLQLNVLVQLNGWRKFEIFCVACGLLFLIGSHIGRFREDAKRESEAITAGLWVGSFLLAAPLFVATAYQRSIAGGPSLFDDLAVVTATVVMLTTGSIWRIKATTLLGGGTLAVFLLIVVGSLIYQPQIALGVYLLSGGGAIFAAGVLLSIYRERLLALPDQIAKREGLFRIIGWR